jgi:hypothetical protein
MDIRTLFADKAITGIPCEDDRFELILLDYPEKRCKILMTSGLSNYKMPVHKKYTGREHTELYFCLPSYWEIENPDEKYSWPVVWLHKLGKHLLDKQLWYGPGHSFENKDHTPLSSHMKSQHLILLDPMCLQEELAPKLLEEKTIFFLGLTPLYSEELDYKQAKGTFKLEKKMKAKMMTEKLDDFRVSFMRSRFRFF